ncbi:MAG: ABC transporter permease [Pseudomonadota bacterium]
MSPRRVKALAKKEFIQMRRDVRSLIGAIFIPLLMIFLFGYALSLDVDRIPTLAYDRDQTPTSRDFIQRFSESSYFTVVEFIDRDDKIDRDLTGGRALMALVIPNGFGAKVKQGQKAPVQVIFDGSDSNTATIALGYVKAVVAGFDLDIQSSRIKKAGLKMAAMPLELRIRVWFNPEMKSKNFIIPGLTAVILMTICSLMTALTVAKERETKTLEQLISTPLTSGELLAGKLLPYILVGLLDLALVVGFGVFVFQVPFRGSLIELLVFSLIFLVGALSWGLFLSVTAKNQLQASQLAMISVFLPSFLLSGFIYPIENMPLALRIITYVVPARYFVEIMKGLFLQGVGLKHLWPQAAALALYSFLVLNLARKKFSKRLL